MPPLRRGRFRVGRVVAAALAVLLVAAGCQVDTLVTIRYTDAGRGSVEVQVTLDREAVQQLGGDVGEVLELDDVRDAGWEVADPEPGGDGTVVLTATKRFGTPSEGARVIEEIGALRDFRFTRQTPFAETEWRVKGVLDLSGGLEQFGDEGLAAELDGFPIGRPVEDIEAEIGEPVERMLDFRVRLVLPGTEAQSNADLPTAVGGTWQARLGDDPVTMRASTTEARNEVQRWMYAGYALAGLLLVLLLVRAVLWLIHRRRDRGTHAAT